MSRSKRFLVVLAGLAAFAAGFLSTVETAPAPDARANTVMASVSTR